MSKGMVWLRQPPEDVNQKWFEIKLHYRRKITITNYKISKKFPKVKKSKKHKLYRALQRKKYIEIKEEKENKPNENQRKSND